MGRLKALWERHPRLLSWAALSIGMLAAFFVVATGITLAPLQRLAVAGAVVALAGLCVLIVFWE